MEIRPIKTEDDYRTALHEVERLMDAAPGSEEEARLEGLGTLVEAYEARHYPIPPPDPIAALEYYMEARGVTRKDLEELIGSRGRVTEILNRRRTLTLPMIRKLNIRLGIPADALVPAYPLAAQRLSQGKTEPTPTARDRTAGKAAG